MQNRLSSDLEEIFATIKNSSLLIFEVLKNSMGEYTQNTNKTGDLQLQADILAVIKYLSGIFTAILILMKKLANIITILTSLQILPFI